MKRRAKQIHWGILFVLIAFHAGALAAPFFFSWEMLGLALGKWVIAGLGICIGYHRLLAHRSFRTSRLVEYFLTFCGTLALHGGAVAWLRSHLPHHADTEGLTDPHSPRHGYFWSYIGWKIYKNPNLEKTRTWKNIERLRRDPIHIWLNRLFWVPTVCEGLLYYYLWGVPGMLWGVFVPGVFCWRPTWLVNLVGHKLAYRRFETNDDSRNNAWIAPLRFGEGFHHNHHYKPNSARHGFRWYEIDPSWYVIRTLQFFGMVWGVITPR